MIGHLFENLACVLGCSSKGKETINQGSKRDQFTRSAERGMGEWGLRVVLRGCRIIKPRWLIKRLGIVSYTKVGESRLVSEKIRKAKTVSGKEGLDATVINGGGEVISNGGALPCF